jgi:hypothetical protein
MCLHTLWQEDLDAKRELYSVKVCTIFGESLTIFDVQMLEWLCLAAKSLCQ